MAKKPMSLVDEIQKECGLSDDNQDVNQWLSTGLVQLNKVLSGRYHGGFPVGRITEIYGKESCGKTAIATVAMVETQRVGGFCVFLDHEHSFSLSRAKQFGLDDDPNKWLYKQPTTAEESFALIEKIINIVRNSDSQRHITIVVDSVAAMVTKSQQETAFGEEKMNTRINLPTVMSSALPKLASMINKMNVTLILLNQTRDNVGQMMGDKTKTPGGNATKFYASVRIQLTKIKTLKGSENAFGEIIRALGKKNKTAPPLVTGEYINLFETGIDFIGSHLKFANELGLLGDSQGWLEWDGKKYRAKDLTELFQSNPEEYQKFIAESFKDDDASTGS